MSKKQGSEALDSTMLKGFANGAVSVGVSSKIL